MPAMAQTQVQNQILARLRLDDFAHLHPFLRRVDLRAGAILHSPNDKPDAVYFLESGYASLMTIMSDKDAVEVGIVGREGMVGVPIIYGTDCTVIEATMQRTGVAYRMSAESFRRALDERPMLRAIILHYAMTFNVQVIVTATCNGLHRIEQRRARWLLMVRDRLDDNEIIVTHECLSMLLNVRRAGITVAMGRLQKNGLIESGQGHIKVVDRTGLQKMTCDCYKNIRNAFERTLKKNSLTSETGMVRAAC